MALSAVNPSGVGTAFQYPTQTTAGLGITAQLNAVPGPVNAPIIFEPGPELTNDETQVFMIVTGAFPNWGGCVVNLSLDNTTFGVVGTILSGGVQGVLTATFPSGSDPDTVNTLSVDITMSNQQIIAGTTADADKGVTLAYVDGELITYTAATLTSAFNYDLDTYIRRGFYGSTIGSHAAGTQFGLIGAATFQENFLSHLIGTTVYFKFQSFNTLGGQIEDIGAVTSYSYTLLGSGIVPQGTTAYVYNVPVTGATITLSFGDTTLIINPATQLATLTVVLPPDAVDGQVVRMSTSHAIVAITISPAAGDTVSGGGPFTLTTNGGMEWLYRLANKTWYREY